MSKLIPPIGQNWPDTVNPFCGILPSKTAGEPDYALLLVSAFIWLQTWDSTMALVRQFGKKFGAANLAELALLRATMPQEFQPGWYWSCEQDPEHATLASGQDMATGRQDIEHVGHVGYAVLVQRVPLVPAPATPLA